MLIPSDDDLGMRVDRFLLSSQLVLQDTQHRPSHALLNRLVRRKAISLKRAEGVTASWRCTLAHRLEPGDVIMFDEKGMQGVMMADIQDSGAIPEARDEARAPTWLMPSTLLYVCPHFVVLDKPDGVPVQVRL